MRVIVCGGRDYDDRARVYAELDALSPDVVIEGGANGADYCAYRWVREKRGCEGWERYEAEWDKHGRGAGPLRNQRMLDEGKPDLVLAFPGGRGTADMVRRAERAGVPVKHCN